MKTIAALALLLLWTCYAAPAHAAFGDELFKLTASDAAAGDVFGSSVALSGNTALVGATGDDGGRGSAYLFDDATGQQLFKLTASASDAAAFDQLGASVALSGNRALVGALGDNGFRGAAYLFDVATGQQLFKLTASDAAAFDHLGVSVALSGNRALVGANGDDGGRGSAYLFDVTTGQQLLKLTASDGAADDYSFFGASVALSGNTALVGSWQDGDSGSNSGSAYLFNVTTGQQLFKLTASDAAAGDVFGRSVALSGNTALVGATWDDGVRGSAYLFDVTTGQQLLKLTASDAAGSDWFGYSVALSGNMALVGASEKNDAGFYSGSAYLFDVTTGQQLLKLTASDAAAGDRFGSSVALSGSTALVGARTDDDDGDGSGSAYLFDVVPEPVSLLMLALGLGILSRWRRADFRAGEFAPGTWRRKRLRIQVCQDITPIEVNNMSRRCGFRLSFFVGLGIVLANTAPARATTQDIPLTNPDFELPGPPGTKTYAFDVSGAPIPAIIPGWTFPGPGAETFGHPERMGDSGTVPGGNPGNEMLLSMHDGIAYQVSSFALQTIPSTQQYVFSFDAHDVYTIDSNFIYLFNSCQLTVRFTYGASRTTLDTFVVAPDNFVTTYQYVISADSPLLTAPHLGEVLGIEFDTTSSALNPLVAKSWVGIDNVNMQITGTGIPEPSSVLLVGMAVSGLLVRRRFV